jgi:hypothetical protein
LLQRATYPSAIAVATGSSVVVVARVVEGDMEVGSGDVDVLSTNVVRGVRTVESGSEFSSLLAPPLQAVMNAVVTTATQLRVRRRSRRCAGLTAPPSLVSATRRSMANEAHRSSSRSSPPTDGHTSIPSRRRGQQLTPRTVRPRGRRAPVGLRRLPRLASNCFAWHGPWLPRHPETVTL